MSEKEKTFDFVLTILIDFDFENKRLSKGMKISDQKEIAKLLNSEFNDFFVKSAI